MNGYSTSICTIYRSKVANLMQRSHGDRHRVAVTRFALLPFLRHRLVAGLVANVAASAWALSRSTTQRSSAGPVPMKCGRKVDAGIGMAAFIVPSPSCR